MIVKSILDTDLYKFTTSYAYMKLFPQARGTFEFFDRDLTEYPEDFVQKVYLELSNLGMLHLTNSELDYMTSNCYLAMKYEMPMMGTHPHEWFMFHGAMYGYKQANYMALENWVNVYDGDLGIALSDTYTSEVFMKNLSRKQAKLFDGVRCDSGDEFKFINSMIARYKELDDWYWVSDLEELAGRTPIANGNIQARCRMIHLYDIASIRKGLVMSTDNQTEYQLGFWTIHGDVSDLDQIGAKDYATVDDILSRFIPFENFRKSYDSAGQIMHPHDEMAESDCWSQLCARHGEDVVNKVWSRHLASEFKRKKAPIYISRELYE